MDVTLMKLDSALYQPRFKMPGRTRPIEKFAEATAKCSPEVRAFATLHLIVADQWAGRCLRQVRGNELPEHQERLVCQGIHGIERLLSRKWTASDSPAVANAP